MKGEENITYYVKVGDDTWERMLNLGWLQPKLVWGLSKKGRREMSIALDRLSEQQPLKRGKRKIASKS